MVWNLDSIIIQIFTCLIFGTALGTVLYLIWKMIGRWTEKKEYVDVSYWIWKIVVLSFWCPISFIVLLKIRKIGQYGFDFWQTKIVLIISVILVTIWMIGMLVSAVHFVGQHRKIHKSIKQYKDKANKKYEKEIKEISKELKIHRKVQPIVVDFIEIPMAYGLFQPKILIPYKEYDQEELEVILLHELVHHKHHDLFWKQLFQITRCIYWFHPAMKDILRQLDQWGETACDITVSQYVESVKDYFNIIITMAVDRPECDVYMAGLCEGTKLLMLRMQRMNAYMKKKPLKKAVSVCLIIGIFGISAVTVMASTVGYAVGYGYVVDKTDENDSAEIIDEEIPMQKYEKTKKIKKGKNIKIPEKIPKLNDPIAFGRNMKPGESLEGKKTYVKKDMIIDLSVSSGMEEDGDSKDIAVGIMDMEGNVRYVNDNWDLWHCFKIEKSGYYKIYVENYGDRTISMAGTCALKKEEKNEEVD